LEATNVHGQTPLHIAAIKNFVGALPLLLGMVSFLEFLCVMPSLCLSTEAGAIVDVKDLQGRTPLHWACFFGFAECSRLLVQHGAYLSEKDATGNTYSSPLFAMLVSSHLIHCSSPIDYAISKKFTQLATFLEAVKATQPLRFDPQKIATQSRPRIALIILVLTIS